VRRSEDHGLVLRRFRWSESSLVVHVLTRDHGRVHLLARGAYRPKSRFYAVLDLFDELSLSWTSTPDRELQPLVEGQLEVRRRGVTADLECYSTATSLLELAHLGSRQGQAQPELFRELGCALDRLDAFGRGEGGPPPTQVRIEFELALLGIHGISPALMTCASCGGPSAPMPGHGPHGHPRAWFSAGAGGRLCAGCAAEARAAGRRVGTLPLDVLVAADRMVVARAAGEPAPELSSERLERVRDFVERFLDYQLETRPRSHRKFLEHANRNAPTS
jgi:DNA repair protein RecO (recombination protein O)